MRILDVDECVCDTKFSSATDVEIPPLETSSVTSLTAYKTHRFAAFRIRSTTPFWTAHCWRVGHAPESKPPIAVMTRGNQRDKAREKNLKDQAGAVWISQRFICPSYTLPGRTGRALDASLAIPTVAHSFSGGNHRGRSVLISSPCRRRRTHKPAPSFRGRKRHRLQS